MRSFFCIIYIYFLIKKFQWNSYFVCCTGSNIILFTNYYFAESHLNVDARWFCADIDDLRSSL